MRPTHDERKVERMSDEELGAPLEGAPLVPSATPVRFARLAALIPALQARTASGVSFNPWGSPATFDPLMADLYQIAHEDGCIFKFDWPAYQQAERTYLEPGRVETADLETCRKLLTIIVRQERFCEGSLSSHIKSGFASRIVSRIGELTWTTPAPPCPRCAAAGARCILRGYPTRKAQEAAESAEVVLGGCMVSASDPVWRCRECKHDFGRIGELVTEEG